MAVKNRTRFTSTLKNELITELHQINKDTDIPISKLLDRAVTLLLEDMKKDDTLKK